MRMRYAVGRIEQDRVQAEPAAARLPLRPLRMIPEAFHQRPGIAASRDTNSAAGSTPQ